MTKFFTLNILLFCSIVMYAQKYTVSGYISDKATGERLINANVYDAITLQGSTANTYGFYSLTLPAGEVSLVASFMGYDQHEVKINLTQNMTLNFELEVRSDELDEITVYGNEIRNKVESTQMSLAELSSQKLQKVPVILGEADVLKVVQLLPGVQAGTEGTSGIYVRGGGPDQNLFLLDGVPVYNAGHLLGFFSVFNPDAVKTVKLYKGGFPARFGGRLSSVVDIAMKDGNMKELKGDFSIGLISSKLMLEGPIVKDKTSFMISARRTYVDILAQPMILYYAKTEDEEFTGGAFFHDYNLKLNHTFSDRSRLYLSSYFGKDKAYRKESYTYDSYKEKYDFGISWGNTIASVRWNYLINSRLFSNTTVTYSRYLFDISDEYYSKDLSDDTTSDELFRYYSGIRDVAAKIDFDYFPAPNHAVKFGASYTNHYFTPGAFNLKYDTDVEYEDALDTVYGNSNISAHEWSVYIEDDFTITDNFKLNGGIYLSLFNVEGVNYLRPQPRLSIRYKVNDDWSLKASYSRMAQHVHLLTTSGISMPTDLWVPVTKRFEPPISDQVALGTAINLPFNLTLTLEGFYKNMLNLIEYKDGASFTGTATNWEDKVEKGRGWSYGGEFMLEKTVGKTTGWIGYTLSWNNRQFENINYGEVFPAKYDRRHDVSIVLTHQFSEKFDIGATWVYGTGNAVTLAYTEYQLANIPGLEGSYGNINNYGGRNNYRMPATHRLDVGLNFHKKKKNGIATWSLSAYNAYNHHNPFYIYWDSGIQYYTYVDGELIIQGDSTTKLKQFSLFPIIPSISYSFKF